MANRKRKSSVLDQAHKRLAGVESISLTLNLGNNLTAANYRAVVVSATAKLDAYNTLLSSTDAALNDLQKDEKTLRELTERMLEAVGSVYGHDSNEYEKAGGTRKVDRKRPVRKKKTT